MNSPFSDLQRGDECPLCGNESYGGMDSICRSKAGNLMCRTCGMTF